MDRCRPTTARILVVESDEALRDSMAMALVASGYDVESAASAASGHALLEARAYDAIVVDLSMEPNGLEIYEFVEEAVLPVVVVSGHSDPAIQRRVLEAGAEAYLAKPFSLAELRRALHEAMAA